MPKSWASVDKITWCHVEPNGNQETLHLPLAALEQAGHVDANGNPLHAGDHAGECVEPSPTAKPTPTPCPNKITPTPTEEEITPSPTETPTVEVTPSPTSTPNQGGPGDGRSDGLSSCPDCTKAHDNYPRSNYDNSVVPWK